MSKDDKCVAMHEKPLLTEDELVNKENKGIQNVLVYVKAGWEKNKYQTPSDPVTINQEGCTYKPHVFGMMPGQKISILNSDDTTHNIHGLPSKSKEFNFGQNKKGAKDEATIDNPEFPVRIKCDIHPWMMTYVGVTRHPYFAVSGADGAFTIARVPAGRHTIRVWHERYGFLSRTVDVKADGTATVDLSYTWKEKPSSASMEDLIVPAGTSSVYLAAAR